jgi:hypothetical protein
MYINGVFSVEDFDLKTVVIPSLSSIITMNQSNFPQKEVDELEAINW